MKKFVLPLFSCLLVLSLLLGSFATAKAAPGDDPVVTPVSGDTDFTTEVVAIASLPGTVELAGGMLAPVGFSDGEAQFGGNGILVTGFDSGKATACFNLSAAEINQGWGGKVAVWDGAKWVRLATTITTPDETNTAIACATITGSGTYAFIKYVAEPDKLSTGMHPCNYNVYMGFGVMTYSSGDEYFSVHGFAFSSATDLHEGMYVTIRPLAGQPASIHDFQSFYSGVLHLGTYPGDLGVYRLEVDPPYNVDVFAFDLYPWPMYVTFDNCYQIVYMFYEDD